jgi:hypothetical protein
MKSRRRVLINIFKHYGQYNIVIAAALVLYFPIRKIGITATLIQSAVIMLTVSAIALISIITGGYFAVKQFIFTAPVEKQINEERKSKNNSKSQIKKEIPKDKFENKIIFQGFDSSSVEAKIVKQLNEEILKELYLIRGQGNVLRTPTPEGSILIVSSLEKLESKPELKFIITIKAVNLETGLISIIKEDTVILSELSEKSKNIMKEIIATIK